MMPTHTACHPVALLGVGFCCCMLNISMHGVGVRWHRPPTTAGSTTRQCNGVGQQATATATQNSNSLRQHTTNHAEALGCGPLSQLQSLPFRLTRHNHTRLLSQFQQQRDCGFDDLSTGNTTHPASCFYTIAFACDALRNAYTHHCTHRMLAARAGCNQHNVLNTCKVSTALLLFMPACMLCLLAAVALLPPSRRGLLHARCYAASIAPVCRALPARTASLGCIFLLLLVCLQDTNGRRQVHTTAGDAAAPDFAPPLPHGGISLLLLLRLLLLLFLFL